MIYYSMLRFVRCYVGCSAALAAQLSPLRTEPKML